MAAHTNVVANVEFNPSDLIMFKAKEDGFWYRGLITKVSKKKNNVSIFCPDYGFLEKIDIEEKDVNIQPLFCKELNLVKYFASSCRVNEEVQLEDLQAIKVSIISFDSNSMEYAVDIVPY